MKICLIDDDETQHFILREQLEILNHPQDLISFSEAKVALDYFSEHAQNPTDLPDLIFLDINMPIMNGWEFLSAFQELLPTLNKTLQVKMLSSSTDARDVNRADLYPMVNDYLEKPLRLQQLKQFVDRE